MEKLYTVGKNKTWSCLWLRPSASVLQTSEVAQSCPTLCDPIDGSPPGSPVPWILQARVPEWGAIAFNTIIPNPPKNVIFIIGDWNGKVGSQEIPGVTVKFGLGVQNEAGQMLIEFCKRMHWSYKYDLLCCTPETNTTM